MKNFYLLPFITFVFLSSISYSQSDIRNTKWGMNMDEVIRSEGSKPNKEDVDYYKRKELIYYLDLDSRDVVLTYIFSNNRLDEVTLRVHWGRWQTDSKHDLKDRYSSMYKLIIDFINKFNKPTFGWHFMNEQFSLKGRQFNECLGQNRIIKDYVSADIEKVEACVYKYADLRQNGDSFIDYAAENERTSAKLRFPLKHFPVKDEIIGWVFFKSKVPNSSF